jgi:hypothetical protein
LQYLGKNNAVITCVGKGARLREIAHDGRAWISLDAEDVTSLDASAGLLSGLTSRALAP